MSNFAITELNRRLANLIRLGKVTETDYESGRVKVEIGELVSGWLPWLTSRAGNDRTWWAPEPDEQVVVISPSGDIAQGVVLMGLYQSKHPAPLATPDTHQIVYSDGAVIEYDRQAHHLNARLPSGGTARLEAEGGVTIIGDVDITGNVTISGNIDIGGDASVAGDTSVTGEVSAADVKAVVSLNGHKHVGGSGGPVGTPIP